MKFVAQHDGKWQRIHPSDAVINVDIDELMVFSSPWPQFVRASVPVLRQAKFDVYSWAKKNCEQIDVGTRVDHLHHIRTFTPYINSLLEFRAKRASENGEKEKRRKYQRRQDGTRTKMASWKASLTERYGWMTRALHREHVAYNVYMLSTVDNRRQNKNPSKKWKKKKIELENIVSCLLLHLIDDLGLHNPTTVQHIFSPPIHDVLCHFMEFIWSCAISFSHIVYSHAFIRSNALIKCDEWYFIIEIFIRLLCVIHTPCAPYQIRWIFGDVPPPNQCCCCRFRWCAIEWHTDTLLRTHITKTSKRIE